MNDVEILVTGPKIMKGGTRGTEPVIEELIKNADREIQLVAYLFTSSAIHLLELIKQSAEKGIKITIIVNDFNSQEKIIRNELIKLSKIYPHVKIYNFIEQKPLHAKIIVADRKKAIVGSANFSWSGMYTNYEIGIAITGESAWKLAQIIDSLSKVSNLI